MECYKCGVPLIKGSNWYPSQEVNRKYICNDCQRKNRDPDKHLRTDAVAKRERARKARSQCIELLGGKCIACGFDDERALCIDHVNGGGRIHRKRTNSTYYYEKILTDIQNGSSDYQCLCANCNVIKAVERKEFGYLKHR